MFDKYRNCDVSITNILAEIRRIFITSDDDINTAYCEWADKENIRVENLLVDFRTEQYVLYRGSIDIKKLNDYILSR